MFSFLRSPFSKLPGTYTHGCEDLLLYIQTSYEIKSLNKELMRNKFFFVTLNVDLPLKSSDVRLVSLISVQFSVQMFGLRAVDLFAEVNIL